MRAESGHDVGRHWRAELSLREWKRGVEVGADLKLHGTQKLLRHLRLRSRPRPGCHNEQAVCRLPSATPTSAFRPFRPRCLRQSMDLKVDLISCLTALSALTAPSSSEGYPRKGQQTRPIIPQTLYQIAWPSARAWKTPRTAHHSIPGSIFSRELPSSRDCQALRASIPCPFRNQHRCAGPYEVFLNHQLTIPHLFLPSSAGARGGKGTDGHHPILLMSLYITEWGSETPDARSHHIEMVTVSRIFREGS